MGSNFPIAEAQIVGLFGESVAYGIYTVTLSFCAVALLREHDSWKPARRTNWLMVVVGILLFCVATLDLTLGLSNTIRAFVFMTGPGGPLTDFTNISNWVNVMKVCYTNPWKSLSNYWSTGVPQ